ncbi:hypothetical protein MJO28_002948 [Puccinia striiformis f. sp. tritici]|uniref:Uncharacterized protein n=1 Tax=Puccinia striiformis f. sp. tritici TaxID=168172 RepID=A0ACC0ERA4_9BASI|nr:hypothetical protein MJO28_002948 [Puccinia striiformis f. sp. tritici]
MDTHSNGAYGQIWMFLADFSLVLGCLPPPTLYEPAVVGNFNLIMFQQQYHNVYPLAAHVETSNSLFKSLKEDSLTTWSSIIGESPSPSTATLLKTMVMISSILISRILNCWRNLIRTNNLTEIIQIKSKERLDNKMDEDQYRKPHSDEEIDEKLNSEESEWDTQSDLDIMVDFNHFYPILTPVAPIKLKPNPVSSDCNGNKNDIVFNPALTTRHPILFPMMLSNSQPAAASNNPSFVATLKTPGSPRPDSCPALSLKTKNQKPTM